MGKIASLKMTDALLRLHSLNAKQSYGQNFIITSQVVEDIVKLSNADKNTVVIEIGAGLGALTEELVSSAKHVIAYEIDSDLIPLLKENLKGSNLEIINADFMQIDLDALIAKYPNEKIMVMSNLPYYITSDILIKLFKAKRPIESVVVMLQKEVGIKLAKPLEDKEKNELSMLAQFCSDIKVLKYVSKNDFLPRPKVDSVVLQFSIKKTEISTEDFATFLKIIYKNRRKTILNNLVECYIDKDKILSALNSCQISPTERAEKLDQNQIIDLLVAIKKEMA